MITAKNLVKHELTGLKVEITESTDPNKIGIKGTVISESQGIITIDTGKETKRIPKKECVFRFFLENTRSGERNKASLFSLAKAREKEAVDVIGTALIGRPEDRIKK